MAGSTILHLRRAIKDHKWKQAGTLLDDLGDSALLRSSGGIDVTRGASSADTLRADAKVYIADTLVISAMTHELDLMEQAWKSVRHRKHCSHLVNPSEQSVVFQVELT